MGSLLPCRQKQCLGVFFFLTHLLIFSIIQSADIFWEHRLRRSHSVETSQHFMQVNFIKTLQGLHIFRNRMIPAAILHFGGKANNLNTFSFKITHCQKREPPVSGHTWWSLGNKCTDARACGYSHSVEQSAGYPYLSGWSGLFRILIFIFEAIYCLMYTKERQKVNHNY